MEKRFITLLLLMWLPWVMGAQQRVIVDMDIDSDEADAWRKRAVRLVSYPLIHSVIAHRYPFVKARQAEDDPTASGLLFIVKQYFSSQPVYKDTDRPRWTDRITQVVRFDHPGSTVRPPGAVGIYICTPASLRPDFRKFSCKGREVQIVYM